MFLPRSHFFDLYNNSVPKGGKRYPIISRHKSILRPPLRSDCIFFLSDICQDNSAHFPLISFPSAIPTNKVISLLTNGAKRVRICGRLVVEIIGNFKNISLDSNLSFEQQSYSLRRSNQKMYIYDYIVDVTIENLF